MLGAAVRGSVSRSKLASVTMTVAASTPFPNAPFNIGTPGAPWGDAERKEWLAQTKVHRTYRQEVLDKLDALRERYDVEQYGALSRDPSRFPLYAVKSKGWSDKRPCVLVTGGVHGYETSGVQGAISFLATAAEAYASHFNLLVVPCVSPWGYETINRWTYEATDPNRSFNPDGEVVEGRSFNPEAATEESAALLALLAKLGLHERAPICHIDLHETTDTDESEFRPAKAMRDGTTDHRPDVIPDGFYLVADITNPQAAWHAAIIEAVRAVTHIAPPDADGNIIGEKVVQDGVIAIPSPKLIGLCAGATAAPYATTTEVYPDSPSADDATCNLAQVTTIKAALDYIIEAEKLQPAKDEL